MRKYLLPIFLLISYAITAQKETALWYFGGGAELDFNSGFPVPRNDGDFFFKEGCSTMSDANGNLLFYTDGRFVFNRNHQIMPNGNYIGGHESSTNSGVIVPKPEAPNIFYIFTIYKEGGALGYREVDMSLDGGLGAIVGDYQLLEQNVTEKITAVVQDDLEGFWAVSHRFPGNEFLAYHITAAGIDTNPVISAVGTSIASTGVRNTLGAVKISPDGKRLAVANQGNKEFQLFDFDTATGAISNPITLPLTDNFGLGGAYGVEFSPNSQVLYGSIERGPVYQYNLEDSDPNNIRSSRQKVSQNELFLGAIQLAIDGKIYVSRQSGNIDVINKPNEIGIDCDYQDSAVYLGNAYGTLGLPATVQSYLVTTITAQNFCLGDETLFSINSTDPILNITWNFGDGNTSTEENPIHSYDAIGNYTVSAEITTATETKTETYELQIFNIPKANKPVDEIVCKSDVFATFNTTTKNAEILDGLPEEDYEIVYYPTLFDAEKNSKRFYQEFNFEEEIIEVFARIHHKDNPYCYDITSFMLNAFEAPVLNQIDNWIVCDTNGDGQLEFDLNARIPAILNEQESTLFQVSFHSTNSDAESLSNNLPLNYTNTNPEEELFYRVTNSNTNLCYVVGSFKIAVITGVDYNTPQDIMVCDTDNNGIANFDFSLKIDEILETADQSSFTVSYFKSMADAETNRNVLQENSFVNTTPYQQTIYVRITNLANQECFTTTAFNLLINDKPQQQVVKDWELCDEDNTGQIIFSLLEKDAEILGNQNPSQFVISYYASYENAFNQDDVIAERTLATDTKEIIYYRIHNAANEDCFLIQNFSIEAFDAPYAIAPMPIFTCDINATGKINMDLSRADEAILGNQNAGVYSVSYFESEIDAINYENVLSATNYETQNTVTTIYARVDVAGENTCFALSSFTITVQSLPNPNIEERYVICPDSPDLIINPGSFEYYQWEDAQGNNISNDQYLPITDLGAYTLIVTETINGITCSKTKFFEVFSSGAPDSFTVDSSGFSDTIILDVNAIGIGDFQYSIDGINYQTSSTFEVFPGAYTIYVRDPLECRTITDTLFVIGYQKFFTPNGDGTNEHWNVIGAKNYPASIVTIYDRYGKLIKQIPANDLGWDGYYNGNLVPEADYWFKFDTGEGQQMTGHFALKR
ncbi:T9SS type B sorting domain-containing protein [uncultured Croceitalea sp.]|uniref:T9SS type B sorting domain-containing protein n=1 Tax=uncultured Croceitalea sp. TaxID=1798908 RepID=UPI0033059755